MKDFFKSLLVKIKRNLDSVILVVPKNGTSMRRFSSAKVLILALLYTSLLLAAGFYLGVILKPVDHSTMSESDIGKINSLNEKVIELTNEVEGLRDSNRKLKNAIFMADSTVFNDKKTSSGKKKLPKEGNILYIIKKIFENPGEIRQENYYFVKPAEGYISRNFNSAKGHFGIDIVLKSGNPVYSAGSGYVAFADYTPESGYIMIINHSDDYVTIYKHCSALLKRQRDFVVQGELIALSGNTGESSGPHLHFEIWKKGIPLDPRELIINL